MKQSKFNVWIPILDGKTLVFNTFSDSRIFVNNDVKKAIEQCDQSHSENVDDTDVLPQLRELGFVVDDNIDEDKAVEYWFQKTKYDSSMLYVNILTTLRCNMKCVYCFEQGAQSNTTMGKDMAQNVCRWLCSKMDEIRPSQLTILFFGGEPLINPRTIKQISEKIFNESRKRSISFSIEITTNGLLLEPDIIDFLVPLGLKRVKVTLDGDEECHDRMRPRKNGKGTYKDILSNLQRIKGKVPIVLGGNYDDSTKQHIPALLDELKDLGFVGAIEKMLFKPILGFPGHKKGSTHSIKACSFSDTNVEDIIWAIKEIEKRGFTPYKDVALGPCEAMRENSFTIDPTGDLYKCAILSGRKEFSIGNIQDDSTEVLFSARNVASMTADVWKTCKDCKFVPICAGGCRNGALAQGKSIDAVCCEKEYFNKVATQLVASEACKEQ